MTSSRSAFAAILAKDLRAELRTLQSLPAMALFAVTSFVIFRFALDRTSLSGNLAAGVLLTTLLFAAILGINRLFVAEREEGGFDAIRLAPIDRTVLFAAKATRAVRLPRRPRADRGPGLRPLLPRLGRRAAAAGRDPRSSSTSGSPRPATLISSMAVNSRARDLLVPLVLLPLVVPLMIAAAGAARRAARGGRARLPRPLRDLARDARPIRFGLPPGRIRGLRLPPGGLSF